MTLALPAVMAVAFRLTEATELKLPPKVRLLTTVPGSRVLVAVIDWPTCSPVVLVTLITGEPRELASAGPVRIIPSPTNRIMAESLLENAMGAESPTAKEPRPTRPSSSTPA